MEDALRQALQSAIESGLDREETKRELISQGFGTAGFAEAYAAVLKELGRTEPEQKVPAFVTAMRNDSFASANAQIHLAPEPFYALIMRAVRSTLGSWKFVLLVSALLSLPTLIALLVEAMLPSLPIFNLFLALFGTIIVVISWGAILYTGAKGYEGVKHVHAFQWASGNALSLIWLSLAFGLTVLGGLICFFIPGVLMFVFGIFAYIVTAHESARGMHAIMRSVDLVRGALWSACVRILLLILIIALPVYVLGHIISRASASIVLFPFAYVATVLVVAISLIGVGTLTQWYLERKRVRPLFDYSSYAGLKWIYRFSFLVGLSALVAFLIFFNGTTFFLESPLGQRFVDLESRAVQSESTDSDSGSNFNIADVFTKSKVEATAASVKLFGGRMGDYNGACEDVSVVAPVVCKSQGDSFVVFAPLVSGTFYCIDAKDFSGEVVRPLEYACELSN